MLHRRPGYAALKRTCVSALWSHLPPNKRQRSHGPAKCAASLATDIASWALLLSPIAPCVVQEATTMVIRLIIAMAFTLVSFSAEADFLNIIPKAEWPSAPEPPVVWGSPLPDAPPAIPRSSDASDTVARLIRLTGYECPSVVDAIVHDHSAKITKVWCGQNIGGSPAFYRLAPTGWINSTIKVTPWKLAPALGQLIPPRADLPRADLKP